MQCQERCRQRSIPAQCCSCQQRLLCRVKYVPPYVMPTSAALPCPCVPALCCAELHSKHEAQADLLHTTEEQRAAASQQLKDLQVAHEALQEEASSLQVSTVPGCLLLLGGATLCHAARTLGSHAACARTSSLLIGVSLHCMLSSPAESVVSGAGTARSSRAAAQGC